MRYDTDELVGERVSLAFGGESAHTLQLASFNTDHQPLGGYTIRLEPRALT